MYNCGLGGPGTQGRKWEGDFRACLSRYPRNHPPPQEKSYIEVYMRPLAGYSYALVFFSRRTDMPYHYRSSLAQLNFTGSGLHEVSACRQGAPLALPWKGVAGEALHLASPTPRGSCGTDGHGRCCSLPGVSRLHTQNHRV